MRFLFALLVQFNFSLNGDYFLDRKSLEEHVLTFGNFRHSLSNFLIFSDFVIQQPSQWNKGLLVLKPGFSFNNDFVELKLFDFQQQFQRGLVLSQVSDFQFRRLRYIRGFEIVGKHGGIALNLLSGQLVSYDYDNFIFFLTNDTTDVIRALNITCERENIDIEATYVRLNRKNMPESSAFQEIYGFRSEVSLKSVSFEINIGRKWGVDPITYSRLKGLGVNANLMGNFNSFNISLSGVYYDSINFWNYNLPPVITEKELLPEAGYADKGLSLLCTYNISDSYFELQLASIVDLKENSIISPSYSKAFQEGYLKFYGHVNGIPLNLKGAREKYLRVEPEYQTLLTYYLEAHSEFNFKVPIELGFKITRSQEDSIKYWMTEITYGLNLFENLSASFQIEYSTKKIPRFNNENFWATFEVIYRFENGSIALSYGKRRGGLVCSGGMCRILPSFDGLKLGLNIGY